MSTWIQLGTEGKTTAASAKLVEKYPEDIEGLSCKDWAALPRSVIEHQAERAEDGRTVVSPVRFKETGEIVPATIEYRTHATGQITGIFDMKPTGVPSLTPPGNIQHGLWTVRGEFDQVVAVGVERAYTNLFERMRGWAKRNFGKARETEHRLGVRWIKAPGLDQQRSLEVDYTGPIV